MFKKYESVELLLYDLEQLSNNNFPQEQLLVVLFQDNLIEEDETDQMWTNEKLSSLVGNVIRTTDAEFIDELTMLGFTKSQIEMIEAELYKGFVYLFNKSNL